MNKITTRIDKKYIFFKSEQHKVKLGKADYPHCVISAKTCHIITCQILPKC